MDISRKNPHSEESHQSLTMGTLQKYRETTENNVAPSSRINHMTLRSKAL